MMDLLLVLTLGAILVGVFYFLYAIANSLLDIDSKLQTLIELELNKRKWS